VGFWGVARSSASPRSRDALDAASEVTGQSLPGAPISSEREELVRLRKQNERLQMERDVLKAAATFVKKPSEFLASVLPKRDRDASQPGAKRSEQDNRQQMPQEQMRHIRYRAPQIGEERGDCTNGESCCESGKPRSAWIATLP
jgi:hypothetical protein